MRILQVIQELATGGAERVVVELARGAQAAGHDVAVAAAPGKLADEIGAPVFPLPLLSRRAWRVPEAAYALDKAIRRTRPDVLHAHNPGMATVAGLVTLRGHRVPSLVTVHGVPDGYAAARRVLRTAGLPVVACGPGVATGLGEHGFDVTATIVNGVRAPAEPANPVQLRHEWQLDRDAPLLVCVGRLVPEKNHALAIGALTRIARGSLVILGEGPLREDLWRLVETEGLRERVVLPGVRDDARAVMAAADVVILPSRSEGLPLAGLEALAAGTPLVATSVRGVRELLTDGENAVLVPVDDPQALADAVERVLSDDTLRATLRSGGLRLAASHRLDSMVDAYLDLYGRLGAR